MLCDRSKTHTAQECFKSPLDQCIIVSSYLTSKKNISSTYNPSFIFNMDETPVYMDICQVKEPFILEVLKLWILLIQGMIKQDLQ